MRGADFDKKSRRGFTKNRSKKEAARTLFTRDKSLWRYSTTTQRYEI
jgi:hypothetical protein